MAVGWYVCPYVSFTRAEGRGARYCAMDDFTPQIEADGGAWRETEVLGGVCLVKVRAAPATLAAINAAPGFDRIPLDALDAPLSSLTVAQRNALRDRLLAAGFTAAELTAAFPNLADVKLHHVLRKWASVKERMSWDGQAWVVSGPRERTTPITWVDAEVADD